MGIAGFYEVRARVTLAAVLVTVAGVAILILSAAFEGFWGSSLPDPIRHFWTQLIVSVGAALVPIGIALVVTDVILRPAFSRDILKLANLQQRVADIGLVELGPTNRIAWPTLFASTSQIRIVLTHPEAWLHANTATLVACTHRPCGIRIFIPNPDHPSMERVANDLGLDPETYREQLLSFTRQVSTAWRQESGVHPEAKLEILHLDAHIPGPIFSFDGTTIVGLSSGATSGVRSLLYTQFVNGPASDVRQWLDTTWQTLEQSVNATPAWVNASPDRSRAGARARLTTTSETQDVEE